MNALKVIAFDCDGVMFDTVKANTRFYNRILNHVGRPDMTPAQFRYAQMHTSDNVLGHLLEDRRDYEAAQAYRREIGYTPFIREMEIEPYLKPLLKKLRLHYTTALATNRSDSIHSVLDAFGLSDAFDLVLSALDVTRPKPAPDLLVKILQHYRIAPAQMLYVGDSQVDEAAARAAGVCLAAYGNRSLKADLHIDRLKDLETILAL